MKKKTLSKSLRAAVAILTAALAATLFVASPASAAPASRTRIPTCVVNEEVALRSYGAYISQLKAAQTARDALAKATTAKDRAKATRAYVTAANKSKLAATAYTAAKKTGKAAGCIVPLILPPFPPM